MLNFYFALYDLCAEYVCELDSLKGFHNSLKVQTFLRILLHSLLDFCQRIS
jgi:hypothetical protein